MSRLNGVTDVQNCRLNRAKNKPKKKKLTKLLECTQTMAYAIRLCRPTQFDQQRPNKICDSLLTTRRQKYISQNATTTLIKAHAKRKSTN